MATAVVAKYDSTAYRAADSTGSEEEEIRLFFSNDSTNNDAPAFGANGSAIDYLPPERPVFRYRINGNTVEADRPLDSAVVRSKKSGSTSKVDFTELRTADSTGTAKKDSVTFSSEETKKSKQVKKSGTSWATVGIILLVLCSFAAAGHKLKIFKLFRHGQNHTGADPNPPPPAQG